MTKGIGIDLVDVKRIEKLYKRWGEQFLKKVFTPYEISYCKKKKRPAVHLAVRFATKESFFKALGTAQGPGPRWKEVEVVNDSNGRPTVRLCGQTALATEKAGVKRILLSLSHDANIGIAEVIVE